MKTDTIKATAEAAEGTLFLGDDWFDPLEAGVRTRIRGFIEELLEAELDAALGRDRYERPRPATAACRAAASFLRIRGMGCFMPCKRKSASQVSRGTGSIRTSRPRAAANATPMSRAE
jgi:hypothetical protein